MEMAAVPVLGRKVRVLQSKAHRTLAADEYRAASQRGIHLVEVQAIPGITLRLDALRLYEQCSEHNMPPLALVGTGPA